MQLELSDLRKFVLDEYGYEPSEEKWETLYYVVGKKKVGLSLNNYWTDDEDNGKQFISFGVDDLIDRSGCSHSCDTLDELREDLDRYLPKKNVQIGLF